MTALEKYREFYEDGDDMDAIERLRFFCSLAMQPQDWLDVESFFEDVIKQTKEKEPLIAALKEIKLRMIFMGWPGESMWNIGSDEMPMWVPDWRYEFQLIEHLLHGSDIETEQHAKDTKRRDDVDPWYTHRRQLEKFLNAAAGDGLICGGVDAAELHVEFFPREHAKVLQDSQA